MIQTPCRQSPQRNDRQPAPVVTKTVARSYTTSRGTIERWIEVAQTAHNQAILLSRQFEAGDASAAPRAHALYDEALAIRRRHERWAASHGVV